MKILLYFIVLLAGCSTPVPLKQTFPEAPKPLLSVCEPLQLAQANTTISELTKIIVENYAQYHLCASTHASFIAWYYQQKKNFEELSK